MSRRTPAEGAVSRREQKRAQYQQVKAHVQKEEGRVQAYGWSLPKKGKVRHRGNGQTLAEEETRCYTNLPFKCFPGQRSVGE